MGTLQQVELNDGAVPILSHLHHLYVALVKGFTTDACDATTADRVHATSQQALPAIASFLHMFTAMCTTRIGQAWFSDHFAQSDLLGTY